jgi:TetR/AcrR family transcriptional regulator, regulator of autoinduction and epiphytic fitness
MTNPLSRRDQILSAAVPLVGHFGLSKTSLADLARAAGISKQGLYLHFASKEELLIEAMHRYFSDGLDLVAEALARADALQPRLVGALDAWFGRHLDHFNPASLDVLEPSSPIAPGIADVKTEVCRRLEEAIAASTEVRDHSCSPAELAAVLFQFGLTWKEGHESRAAFRRTLERCVHACFPLPPQGRSARRKR